jgi:selenoprotein W-related protein
LPRASRLGDELKRELNADVALIAGSGGVYEITVNGKNIFSKARAGRFPEPGEIVSLVKAM